MRLIYHGGAHRTRGKSYAKARSVRLPNVQFRPRLCGEKSWLSERSLRGFLRVWKGHATHERLSFYNFTQIGSRVPIGLENYKFLCMSSLALNDNDAGRDTFMSTSTLREVFTCVAPIGSLCVVSVNNGE